MTNTIANPFEPLQQQLNRIEASLNELKTLIPATVKRDRYLTVEQTSELFRVSRATIYRNVRLNIFPYKKVGNRLYFSELKMTELLSG